MYYNIPAPTGVGTGFAQGTVGITNGATGSDPNHYAVMADGTDTTLTIRGGWSMVVKDAGTSSFDPRVYMVESSGPLTYTVPANSSGTTRVDTICLRVDQSISPDATGSNLPSIYNVQGGASSALGNAPSDGALYYPLALVTIDNGETSLTSADITDKRTPSTVTPISTNTVRTRVSLSGNLTNYGAGALIPFDQIDYDPGSNWNVGGHYFVCPVNGYYEVDWAVYYTCTSNSTGVQFELCNGGSAGYSRGGWAGDIAASENVVAQGSDVIYLAAGSGLTVKLTAAGTGTTTIHNDTRYTRIAINLISTL